jgi:histone chaperone ASF1
MSVVSLLGVNVHNNPAKFTDKYEFEITFECLEELQKGKSSPRCPPGGACADEKLQILNGNLPTSALRHQTSTTKS